nr:hypothetical protein [uncultured Holophaga sp.]
MARPGLLQHRKFRRLCRILGGHTSIALGSLEMIWTSCYENGEEFLGDSEDVEAAACWEGTPGELTQALLAAGGDDSVGFIEEIPDRPGKYQVHDLWHHAPDYVQKRRRRESARRSKSDPCPDIDTTTADDDRTVTGQRTDNGRRMAVVDCHTRAQSGVTPAPAPAPAPAPQKDACAELGMPTSTPDDSPLVAELPCVGHGVNRWRVTEAMLADWTQAFPGVPLRQEVERMRLWLEGNPKRRKTYRGMPSFVLSWLGRAQNMPARGHPPARSTSRATSADQAFLDQLDAMNPGA